MSYHNYDQNDKDRYLDLLKKYRFLKWFTIISTILMTISILNSCIFHIPYKIGKKNFIPYHDSFKNSSPKISAYQIHLPSEYYEITHPVTLRQLSKRWHVSVDEIRDQNKWLDQFANNQPIHPNGGSTPIDVPPTTPTTPPETNTSGNVSKYANEVLVLTNKYRANVGAKPLTIDSRLQKTAQLKSDDMSKNHYFDHTSPTYGSPFDMLKHFGISYSSSGENIAQGQKTPTEVVNAWYNSTGHRANMLNQQFTKIGIGYNSSGNYWTQQFIME